MKGYNVCWIPGTDHAGIATQNKVAQNEVLLNEVLSPTILRAQMTSDSCDIPKIVCKKIPSYDTKIDYKKIPLYNTSNQNLCIICYDNIKNMMGRPCNHVFLCEKCYLIDKDKFINYPCPICRENIVVLEKIFY
jgi:hypothetical protein